MKRNEMERKRIGATLRYVRESRGMTADQLANALLISRPLLSNIEAGRRGLTPRTLLAACEVLKIPPIVLVNADFLDEVMAS